MTVRYIVDIQRNPDDENNFIVSITPSLMRGSVGLPATPTFVYRGHCVGCMQAIGAAIMSAADQDL